MFLKEMKDNNSIVIKITFVVYFLINLIIRTGYTHSQIKEDAVKDNTVGRATPSDRSYAVMLTGLFFTLWGVFGAILMGIVVAILFNGLLFLYWLVMASSICLVLISVWFYIRLIAIENTAKQWKSGRYEDDDIDKSLFISNLEFVIVFGVSLFLAVLFTTGLTLPALGK